MCGQPGHTLKECTGPTREKQGEFDQFADSAGGGLVMEMEFIFIRLCVLREARSNARLEWLFVCLFVCLFVVCLLLFLCPQRIE